MPLQTILENGASSQSRAVCLIVVEGTVVQSANLSNILILLEEDSTAIGLLRQCEGEVSQGIEQHPQLMINFPHSF